MFLWTILFFIAGEVSSRESSTTNRVKRVLNGEQIDVKGQANYAVTRYYVTYATVHAFPWYSWWPWSYESKKYWSHWVKTGSYGQIWCGGAVLTPEIVQTACHCVSEWLNHPEYPSSVTRPLVSHQWESVRVLYIGVNSRFYPDPAMISQKPIKSLKFIVHQQCGKLSGTDYDPNSYDYAWIKIDPSWIYPGSGVPTYRLAFAPIYASNDLQMLVEQIIAKEAVCLLLGFGRHIKNYPVTSPVLLHGWGHAISKETCVDKTSGGVPKNSLPDLMNWFCLETLRKRVQPPQPGDSGGPVTCSDQYMGVVSGHRGERYRDEFNRIYEVYWSLHGDAAHTAYSMTVEYREAFSKEIHDVGVKTFVDLISAETQYALARRLRSPEVTFMRFSQSESSYSRTVGSSHVILSSALISSVLYRLEN